MVIEAVTVIGYTKICAKNDCFWVIIHQDIQSMNNKKIQVNLYLIDK